MNIPLIFLIFIGFLAGLYYCSVTKSSNLIEGMTNKKGKTQCPDILVQKGPRFLLYNSKVAQVPGVNPIQFQNLEDYTEFIDWQRSQGINCPVLYLQHSYNTQGQPVYKVRPSPSNLQGGLPAMLPQNNGSSTSVIKPNFNTPPTPATNAPTGPTKEDGLLYSPNAMDDNWGGATYTQNLVNEGYYKGNEVSIAIN
jgi:hypothetical protein